MKVLGIIIGVLIVVVAAVFVYVAQNANTLVKNAIEGLGSQYLGTRVSVASVDISLTEGSGAINGLEIANPAG